MTSPLPVGPPWPAPGELMPHGPSMVYVERILASEERSLRCRVVPGSQDTEHVDDGAIPTTMAVEYMAQVICIYAGLRAEPARRRDVGYIIAVRDLELSVPAFEVGAPLEVRVTWVWGEAHLGRFTAIIERDGHVCARGALNVYRPPHTPPP